MVGFTAQELLGHGSPAPYWPSELAGQYQKRQEIRLAGQHQPPREGYESVSGAQGRFRFPVLIFEAPLINHEGVQTGWMSAFLDISEQRRVEELSRVSYGAAAGDSAAGHGGRDGVAFVARAEPAACRDRELRNRLDQPVEGASAGRGRRGRTAGRHRNRDASHRAAGRARRQGDQERARLQRRRDKARGSRRALGPDRCHHAAGRAAGAQAWRASETRLAPDLPLVLCDRTMVEQVLLNLAKCDAGDGPGPRPILRW